jgi:nucleoside-diphosphate-sugar epimerase
MRKILVTGATGFVGANLVKALLKKEEDQVFITTRGDSNLGRIDDLKSSIYKICLCSLEKRADVFQLIEKIKPDVIYHLATYGGFPNQTDPERTINSNLNATINLLDAAISNEVSQFINTGSSSEYGIKIHAMKETDLCEPMNLYGITKLAAANYCAMIGRTKNYKVCTLRLFSVYGELEEPTRLYPSIVNALKNNERPKLSKPDSVRDFIHIDKVIDVYLKIIQTEYEPGSIINVGSGKEQTIGEFYEFIARKMGKNIEPLWGEAPSRPIEPMKWEADVNKLKEVFKGEI